MTFNSTCRKEGSILKDRIAFCHIIIMVVACLLISFNVA